MTKAKDARGKLFSHSGKAYEGETVVEVREGYVSIYAKEVSTGESEYLGEFPEDEELR